MMNEVRRWMFRNARAVELALWQFFFESGSRENVLAALSCYQNADGGFGHALEADCWNPQSTPVATWQAVKTMLMIGFEDQAHPLYQGVWRYLESGKDREDYGWRFTVPGNDAWPRAYWWSYGEAENRQQYYGVTAGFTALILRHGQEGTPLYCRAIEDAKRIAGLMMVQEQFGEGLDNFAMLLDAMQEKGIALPDGAQSRLDALKNAAIVRDPAKWTGYSVRPSRFIHSKEDRLYQENKAIVQAEVDFLRSTRQSGGVWPITWIWYGMMEQYGPQFAISENWWKGLVAIENMLFLRVFDKGE